MTFVQLIECRTSRLDEMNRLMDRWVEQTKGKRTATHSVVAKDRADASHIVEIVEFRIASSYDGNSTISTTWVESERSRPTIECVAVRLPWVASTQFSISRLSWSMLLVLQSMSWTKVMGPSRRASGEYGCIT